MGDITKKRLVAKAMRLWAIQGSRYRTAVEDYLRMYKICKEKNIRVNGGAYLRKEILEGYPKHGFLDIAKETEARQFLERLTPAGVMVVIDSVNELEFNYYYNSVNSVVAKLGDAIRIGKPHYPFGVDPNYHKVQISYPKNRRHLAD